MKKNEKARMLPTRGNYPPGLPKTADGKVPRRVFRNFENNRPVGAKARDEARISRHVLPPRMTYPEAKRWFENPGTYDIPGIDCPADTEPTVRFLTRSELGREVHRARAVSRSARRRGGDVQLITTGGEIVLDGATYHDVMQYLGDAVDGLIQESCVSGRPVHMPYIIRYVGD